MRNFRGIDRFYLILAATLLVVGGVVVYSIREIFIVLNTANNINEEIVGAADPRLNVSKLNEAHDIIYGREAVPLDLKN